MEEKIGQFYTHSNTRTRNLKKKNITLSISARTQIREHLDVNSSKFDHFDSTYSNDRNVLSIFDDSIFLVNNIKFSYSSDRPVTKETICKKKKNLLKEKWKFNNITSITYSVRKNARVCHIIIFKHIHPGIVFNLKTFSKFPILFLKNCFLHFFFFFF